MQNYEKSGETDNYSAIAFQVNIVRFNVGTHGSCVRIREMSASDGGWWTLEPSVPTIN